MGVEFCNDVNLESSIVEMLHSLVIDIEKSSIEKIYKCFRDIYNGRLSYEDSTFLSLIRIPKTERSILKNFYLTDEDTHIGIDFPTWFNYSDSKPKLMLVGIDPLRKMDPLPNKDVFRDIISIGTPYDIHRLKELNLSDGHNLYWNLISKLAENYSIYVTDTFKVFFLKNGNVAHRSYNYKPFTNPTAATWQDEIHQRIFEEEVNIIKPSAIVTLGAHPVRWFTSCKKETFADLKEMVNNKDSRLLRGTVPVLPFVHLSGMARNEAKNLYEVDSIGDLPDKYASIVRNYLS
jgi:uracil-DNA glycosylase